MIITMAMFTGEYVTANAIIFTLLILSFYLLIYKIKEKKRTRIKTEKQVGNQISIGFYLGIANVTMLFVVLFLNNYRG